MPLSGLAWLALLIVPQRGFVWNHSIQPQINTDERRFRRRKTKVSGAYKGNYIFDSPRKLVSLWDMVKFLIHEFSLRWDRIEKSAAHVSQLASGTLGNKLLQPNDFIHFQQTISDLKYIGIVLELEKSSHQAAQFEIALSSRPCNFQMLHSHLEDVIQTMKQEMDEIFLAFIPQEKQKYFEMEDLFGPSVSAAFSSAKQDIRNAGNCLSAELYDASVFYLMLVMNVGLLALARHVKVPVHAKPIEYEEWGRLIEKIEEELRNQIKPLVNMTNGPAKDAEFDFYQGLLDTLRYVKDAHRNPIAHARGNYDYTKAVAIFNDVRRFMERLASRVSE